MKTEVYIDRELHHYRKVGRSFSVPERLAEVPPRPDGYHVREMARDLVLVVPSRGRPHNVARLIEAMDATCRGDTTLILGWTRTIRAWPSIRRSGDAEIVILGGLRGRLVDG